MKEIDARRNSVDRKSLQIKVLLWLILLIFVGSLVCLILGVLKTLFSTLVIIAGVLLVVCLIVSWGYDRAKLGIAQKRLESKGKDDSRTD